MCLSLFVADWIKEMAFYQMEDITKWVGFMLLQDEVL